MDEYHCEVLEAWRHDPAVKFIVFVGIGTKAFCAGMLFTLIQIRFYQFYNVHYCLFLHWIYYY